MNKFGTFSYEHICKRCGRNTCDDCS